MAVNDYRYSNKILRFLTISLINYEWTMNIIIPKETSPELRVSMLPQNIEKLVKKGVKITIESGLGATLGISDEDYKRTGASIEKNRKKLLASGDIVLRLRKPDVKEISLLKKGSIHISYLDPFNEPALLAALAKQRVSAISMEMIPRSTRAQKMDALSSQASLADMSLLYSPLTICIKSFP